MLRRSGSDGKTGKTVVDQARHDRGTESAHKRLRRRPADPIRDRSQKLQSSPDVREQSLPSSRHEMRGWHRGRSCTVIDATRIRLRTPMNDHPLRGSAAAVPTCPPTQQDDGRDHGSVNCKSFCSRRAPHKSLKFTTSPKQPLAADASRLHAELASESRQVEAI